MSGSYEKKDHDVSTQEKKRRLIHKDRILNWVNTINLLGCPFESKLFVHNFSQ